MGKNITFKGILRISLLLQVLGCCFFSIRPFLIVNVWANILVLYPGSFVREKLNEEWLAISDIFQNYATVRKEVLLEYRIKLVNIS